LASHSFETLRKVGLKKREIAGGQKAVRGFQVQGRRHISIVSLFRAT